MKNIEIQIYTPLGLYTKVEAKSLLVTTIDGLRALQARHLGIVLPLKIGRLEIINDSTRTYYAIGKGVLYFRRDQAKILVEHIENASDIDLDRALKAKDRALKRLNDQEGDLKRATIALNKALNRIKIKNNYLK